MAGGRPRRISELRVGDEIYGTRRIGLYRRYVKSMVLAHWSSIKPAFRTTLEDGTKLVTSGDHRFLSNLGWRFVTAAGHGEPRRPHLTTDRKSTRLNSSHRCISYAVFCLKKKTTK